MICNLGDPMSLGHPIRPAAVLHNSQVTWLTHVWHDSFIRDMTLVYRIEWQISIIFPSPGIPSLKSQLITCADVAARHSVLSCVAVCCRVLQCVAVSCSALQCDTVPLNGVSVLLWRCVAVLSSVLSYFAVCCRVLLPCSMLSTPERWGAGVETQKNVWGEIGGWGRVPFNETYAPSLSTIYDGA